MALSNLEIASVHEIVGIPYNESYVVHDGIGTAQFLLYTPNLGQPGDIIATISNHLITYLSSVSETKETKIRALVEEWDEISLKPTAITGGSAGSLTQLTYSYEDRRKLVKERIETHIPYLSKWRLEMAKAGSSDSMVRFIPYTR